MAEPLSIIILAAGKGTRMKSDQPKVLHNIAGQPMISWLIDTCEKLDPAQIIVVVGPDMKGLEEVVKPHKTVIQKTQNGTADAVKPTLSLLEDDNHKTLILMGDEPFITEETLREMLRHDLCALACDVDDPSGLGRILVNNDGSLQEIVEEKDCSDEQRLITLCNAGSYCVNAGQLKSWLPQISNDNAAGEYYLTDIPSIAAKDGVKTAIIAMDWFDMSYGINDKAQLAEHEIFIQDELRHQALLNGVQMIDPATVYFSYDTQLEAGTLIEPNVFFGPSVQIEKNVHIKAFTHIEGTTIKEECSVGPFARIRPGSNVGEKSKLGNFVEINRSELGPGSKVGHHCYIGDTVMGKNVNFSAGAITANYDGKDKHKTVIGNNVMVGTNVNLVAPLNIGENAFLAAGSTITKDVPADALAIERGKQANKDGWSKKS